MLDKPCECSLVAAHGGTVYDVRALLLSICIYIIHIITLGEEHIELYGYHSVFLAIHILRLYIKLWSVEGSLAVLLGVVESYVV